MTGRRRALARFFGPDVDGDVADELAFHLAMRERDYARQGLAPDAAALAARARFGDVERVGGELRAHDRRRERVRHRREYMSDLVQDLRYAARGLRRAPGFAAAAVLTLALGIGATTAIFSVVNAVILRPLPYPDADRVAMVWMDNRRLGLREDVHSWPNLDDIRTRNTAFAAIAAFATSDLNLTGRCADGACEPARVAAVRATAELFPVLGVRPALGRAFTVAEQEEGRDAVAVISHGLWQRMFGGRPEALGQTIRLNGRERTVIGVMPPTAAFPTPETELWLPLAISPQMRASRGSFGLHAVGRLRPGVSLERAQADLGTIARQLEQEYPGNRDYGVYLVSLPEQVVGKTLRAALWIMLGAVGSVLLIGCANVANLLLSRAAAREREIGVRLALGARRGRLVHQLLTESLLLAAAGGALGLALGWGALGVIRRLAPAAIPRVADVRLDGVVLAVTALVIVTAGVLFGLVPALQASRPGLAEVLREGARSGSSQRTNRLRRTLAGAQVAMVVVLLSAAGLLVRSFAQLQRVELGFRPDHVLTASLALPVAKYAGDPQRLAFYDALLARVRALPGVRAAGGTSAVFLSSTPQSTNFTIEGREMTPDEQNVEVPLDAATPDYFRTMGIALRRGRTFTGQDTPASTPAVVINEQMARRFWPGQEVIGKRFKYGAASDSSPWLTIVGVVADSRRTGYDAAVRSETFLPIAQYAPPRLTIVVRTVGDPLAQTAAVRAAVRALDADLPLYDVTSVEHTLGEMVAQRRFSMALLAGFAGLALVLGLVGVYGVTAYLVAQRTREVGVRLALGAAPAALVRMVVGEGMIVAGTGLAAGLLGAVLVAQAMRGLLYQVSPVDGLTLGVVAGSLVVATAVANYLPARRAARVDPLTALRAE